MIEATCYEYFITNSSQKFELPQFKLLISGMDTAVASNQCAARFKLYSWQLLVVKTLYLTWKYGAILNAALLAQIPTGYGKTSMILFLACLMCEKHPEMTVFVVVTNDYLRFHMNEVIYQVGQVIHNDREFEPYKRLVIASLH